MSKINEDTFLVILVSIAVIGVCAVFWGLFIYNNSQNIKRDEYIVSHCKNVTTGLNINAGTTYQCGKP